RDADGPAAVAEVALDLADDVRRRVGGQLDAAVHVEAVDRLDQPDRADLDEVFELLAAVGVASGQRAHERHVLLDQLLAGDQVAPPPSTDRNAFGGGEVSAGSSAPAPIAAPRS